MATAPDSSRSRSDSAAAAAAHDAAYGDHLTLRLTDIQLHGRLDDPVLIARFLRDLVARIGMRVLDGPHVATEAGDADKYGHSGVILLYESHAAIHTYPQRRELFLDVFSCKPFAEGRVLLECTRFFGSCAVRERNLSHRGHHWKSPVAESTRLWVASR